MSVSVVLSVSVWRATQCQRTCSVTCFFLRCVFERDVVKSQDHWSVLLEKTAFGGHASLWPADPSNTHLLEHPTTACPRPVTHAGQKCPQLWYYSVFVQAKCGHLRKLVNRLVRHFATAFNTLLSVIFHVVAPSCDVFWNCLVSINICACADQPRKQFLHFHHNAVIDLCCSLNTSKIYLVKW